MTGGGLIQWGVFVSGCDAIHSRPQLSALKRSEDDVRFCRGIFAMDVVGEIVEDIMVLAQQANDSSFSNDFLLLKSNLILDRLSEFASITYTNIDNVVFANLCEVNERLLVTGRTTKGPGRPLIDIPLDMIEFYILCGSSCVQIARMLGVSERTIRRRLEHYGIRYPRCSYLYIKNYLRV